MDVEFSVDVIRGIGPLPRQAENDDAIWRWGIAWSLTAHCIAATDIWRNGWSTYKLERAEVAWCWNFDAV